MKHKTIPLITTTVRANHNPGDTFIGTGLQWLWEQVTGPDTSWYLLNKFSPHEISNNVLVMKQADLVVFGGTPQYNNYQDWKFWYDDELWKEVINPNKIPIAIMAGGSGYPDAHMTPDQFAEHCASDSKTVDIIQQRTENALCFTTRDLHSHALLNKLNIKNDYIACSATFSGRYIVPQSIKPFIALVPPAPKSLPDKYCPKDKAQDFVKNEWMLLFKTLKQQGHNPKIVCHFKEEYGIFAKELSSEDLFYSNDYAAFLRFYSYCHTVVSARLHGVLPAFGMVGTKAIGVSIDTRGLAVTAFHKIPEVKYNEFTTEKILSLLPNLQPSEEADFTPVIDQYKKVIQGVMNQVMTQK